jgi:prefoldin subunit 5
MNKEYIKKLQEAIEELSKYIEQQDNRIKALEQTERERKIVFDWFIHPERGPSKAFLNPCNFNEIKVIAEIGFGKYVFLSTTIHSIHPLIYIGHYE